MEDQKMTTMPIMPAIEMTADGDEARQPRLKSEPFSQAECERLLELITERKEVILNKSRKPDAEASSARTWDEIGKILANEFNNSNRTGAKCRKKFSHLRFRARHRKMKQGSLCQSLLSSSADPDAVEHLLLADNIFNTADASSAMMDSFEPEGSPAVFKQQPYQQQQNQRNNSISEVPEFELNLFPTPSSSSLSSFDHHAARRDNDASADQSRLPTTELSSVSKMEPGIIYQDDDADDKFSDDKSDLTTANGFLESGRKINKGHQSTRKNPNSFAGTSMIANQNGNNHRQLPPTISELQRSILEEELANKRLHRQVLECQLKYFGKANAYLDFLKRRHDDQSDDDE